MSVWTKDPALRERVASRNDVILTAWAANIHADAIAEAVGVTTNLVKVVVCKARKAGDARAVRRDSFWRRSHGRGRK